MLRLHQAGLPCTTPIAMAGAANGAGRRCFVAEVPAQEDGATAVHPLRCLKFVPGQNMRAVPLVGSLQFWYTSM